MGANSLACYFISKAFDSINHKVLLGKLELMGMSGGTLGWLGWFKSYHADKRQSVYINGVLAETHLIALGVPQGSLLGPLLINIYIKGSLSTSVLCGRVLLFSSGKLDFPTAAEKKTLYPCRERVATQGFRTEDFSILSVTASDASSMISKTCESTFDPG